MVGALLATVFLISTLIGIFSNQIDVFYHRMEATRAAEFKRACEESKVLIAKWIAEDPSNRTDGNYVILPPSDNGEIPGDIPYLDVLIGRDPYKRKTKYFSWDLRSEAPPRENLVLRIVSPGRDGIFQTTESSEYCAGDDLCCEATNDELMVTQMVLTPPLSDELDLPEDFQWPENPLEQCCWAASDGTGTECSFEHPCHLETAIEDCIYSCVILKPGNYGNIYISQTGSPFKILIGEKANFEENCEYTGNCVKIEELFLTIHGPSVPFSLAFIGLKISYFQTTEDNGGFYYFNKSFIGILAFVNLRGSVIIQKTVISDDLIWFCDTSPDENMPFNLYMFDTLVKGIIWLETHFEKELVNININKTTIDRCIKLIIFSAPYSTPKFVLNISNSTIKGIGCLRGISIWTYYNTDNYENSEIYLENVKIGSEENILEKGFLLYNEFDDGEEITFKEINFDNSTVIWAHEGIVFSKKGEGNVYGPVYLNNVVNYTNECFINEAIPNSYIHDDNLQCNPITN